jgi:signal transduction histidine kinase/CheY-like chemotaxis protein
LKENPTGRTLGFQPEQIAGLFEQAPAFMAILTGPDHRIDLANSHYLELVGHRDVIGRTVAEALPDAVSQGYLELLNEVYRSGRAFSATSAKYAVQTAPGGPTDERYVDFVYQPITGDQGTVTGIFVHGVDVTDKIAAEARRNALARLTERIRGLSSRADIGYAAAEILGETLGVSRVGYGTIDHEAETLHVDRDWNAPGVETLAGVLALRDYGSFIDSLKRNEFISIADVRQDARTAAAATALEGRSARSFVNVPVVEQGRLVAVLYVNHAEVRDWAPEDLALIREVAERTRTAAERIYGEAALRASEARLRVANETLEAKVEARTRELLEAEEKLRQSQKLEAVGRLTGGLAHDFNNLLMVVQNNLFLLQGAPAGSDPNPSYAAIRRAIETGTRLTRQLLAFARQHGEPPARTELQVAIPEILQLMQPVLGGRVEIRRKVDESTDPVLVDRSELSLALLNLAVNSADAMPRGGTLSVEVRNATRDEAPRDGRFVLIRVTDTGSGIAEDDLPKVFDPFFTTKPVGSGTGLGLSQVYGFCTRAGGTASIASVKGKGTTVSVLLAAAPADAIAPDSPAGLATAAASLGLQVLLVDDNEDVGRATEQVLRTLACEVHRTVSARDAIATLKSGKAFDVVMSDIVMPGELTGIELRAWIREHRPRLPIVLMTGYSSAARDLAGDEAVLRKPVAPRDLAEALGRAAGVVPGTSASPPRHV